MESISALQTAEPQADDGRTLQSQIAALRSQTQAVAAVVELIARVQSQADPRLGCKLLVEDLQRYLGCAEAVVGLCEERGDDCKMEARRGRGQRGFRVCASSGSCVAGITAPGRARYLARPGRPSSPFPVSASALCSSAPPRLLGYLAAPNRQRPSRCALLLGWGQSEPAWTALQRQFLQALNPPLSATLRLLSLARRTRWERGARAFRSWIASRRGVLAVIIAACLLFLLGVPFPYKIDCQCQLEPVLRRFVAAPFDGQLLEALVEPGDVVQVGQSLAELDGREIRWELTATCADLHRVEKERAGSLSTHDVGKAQIAQHEAERLRIKIELLEHRLQELDVRSPLEGVVVDGDLERAQGMPVDQGQVLFEIAPLDRMIVEVAIPESEIAYVREGMPVRIALDAFPQRRWTASLQRVHPRSELREKENVFIAQVPLEDAQGLRPGMRGSASIAAGSHPLGWNLFHRAWASLLIWLGV